MMLIVCFAKMIKVIISILVDSVFGSISPQKQLKRVSYLTFNMIYNSLSHDCFDDLVVSNRTLCIE